MSRLRTAIHSARDRGVLPQYRPDGNVRELCRRLDLSAPISTSYLIHLLDSLHIVDPHPGGGGGSPGGGGGTPAQATVGVELTPTPGAFNTLRVFGKNFVGNETIAITVTSTTQFANGSQSTADNSTTTAAAGGSFSVSVGVSCPAGASTTHRAYATGTSSGRISNSAAASC
jgi:hypothetical protein